MCACVYELLCTLDPNLDLCWACEQDWSVVKKAGPPSQSSSVLAGNEVTAVPTESLLSGCPKLCVARSTAAASSYTAHGGQGYISKQADFFHFLHLVITPSPALSSALSSALSLQTHCRPSSNVDQNRQIRKGWIITDTVLERNLQSNTE